MSYTAYRPRRALNRDRSPMAAIFSLVFFPLALAYEEILLRIFDSVSIAAFFGTGLWRALAAACALGTLIAAIIWVIPPLRIRRIIAVVVLVAFPVIFIAERFCKAFFNTYYALGFMLNMSGDVAGNFMDSVISVILRNIIYIPLAFLPLILYFIFRRTLVPEEGFSISKGGILLAAAVLLQLLSVLLCRMDTTGYYNVQFTTNSAVPRFGLVTSLRLEAQYAIFGQPSELQADLLLTGDSSESGDGTGELEPDTETDTDTETETETEPVEVVYDYNVMDIDWDTLIADETDSDLLAMHQYFSNLTPTQQNEYTGMFAGKNLIVLTAEAFCTAVIDPELTPTLYQLSTSGFVFENYYQPDWTQSTTGGEFAAMTGVIPTWISSKLSFVISADDYMPFALGNQLRAIGYTTTAYHNNGYTYYHRDSTHPNLGYDYYGIGNGLELATSQWPNSDLEMMEATIPNALAAYEETGTPFHLYYMTVSGHCEYNWGNAMSAKNRAAVEELDYSDTVKAYLACQLELEYALEYLMEQLEAADLLENTVIVLTGDHYPYALAQNYGSDYYPELTGIDDTEKDTSRYRNTLILWCGDMEETVTVTTPCSSIDIIPTLSNLFGLEYDSRLLSGRDIFSTNYDVAVASNNMPLVIFADSGYGNSWITEAGTYEASTGTFTPNEGYEDLGEDYVSAVKKIVSNKYIYAKYLISRDYYSVVLGE